jgi:autotransporter-associated beta strand protein
MLRKISIPALSISTLFVSRALATDWTYTSQGSEATELTGGYGAVADPSNGSVYNDGFGDYSYPVILDSGSSGFLMSETVTDEFSVPLQPGQTYTETGIGGSEVENVTEPLTAYYAPASDTNPDDTSTMTAYGTYTFESRQNDPFEGFIYFDIVGTPIIQNQVMVVNPNQSYDVVQDTLGFLTAQTTLQPTAPVLPSKGLYHVPITWTNFVSGTPVPSEGLNPVVNGVTARGPNGTDVANNWLFDSGAQFTIISPTYASQLGINLSDPITTIQGEGVGGSIVTFDGFQITDIALPLSNGDRLVIDDPIVYVPEGTTLPAGLTGVLGENLFMQSTDEIDPDTGLPVDTYAPLFSEWYLNGPGSQLVLYDPNSIYNAANLIWNNAGGSGNGTLWDTAQQNWNNGSALAAYTDGSNVTFNDSNNGHYSVTLNATVSPASVTVNNSAGNYTISGTGSIAGAGSLTKSGGGTLILSNTGTNTYSGGTTVSGGTLLIGAVGALPAASNVTITGGALQLGAGTGSETLSALSIAAGGSFNVNNNHVYLSYTTLGIEASEISAVRGYLTNGYNGGAWNGTSGSNTGGGIDSSAAGHSAHYALGYADGNDHVVNGLSAGQIEIKYTLYGDANLDGVVNGSDFGILAAHFGQQVGAWDEADFNYDGVVNGTDFGLLASNFGQQASGAAVQLPASDWAALDAFAAANGLMADVPEPASIGLIVLAGTGAIARRRRRAGYISRFQLLDEPSNRNIQALSA